MRVSSSSINTNEAEEPEPISSGNSSQYYLSYSPSGILSCHVVLGSATSIRDSELVGHSMVRDARNGDFELVDNLIPTSSLQFMV